MNAYDWIVVGNGFAGAALGYELKRVGFSVLILEQDAIAHNATRFSYGGIPYWSAKTPALQQLFHEGIERHRQFSDELGVSTEFREMNLLLLVKPEDDIDAIAQQYQGMSIPPTHIDAETAQELEPLLNQGAIAGAFVVRHAHVNPQALLKAYNHAFLQMGGVLQTEQVLSFVQRGDRVIGVQTPTQTYSAGQVALCAGGMSRSLLKSAGLTIPCYYSQAELIETAPVDIRFQTLVMPAQVKRFGLEAAAGAPHFTAQWDEPNQEIVPPILDPGIFQFQDQHLCMGQISRALTSPQPTIDALQSEHSIREAISRFIPAIKDVPGQWQQCLVAFSGDQKPLVGTLPDREGLVIFSGFSGPFALLPPVAQRFAQAQAGTADDLLPQFSPKRFLAT